MNSTTLSPAVLAITFVALIGAVLVIFRKLQRCRQIDHLLAINGVVVVEQIQKQPNAIGTGTHPEICKGICRRESAGSALVHWVHPRDVRYLERRARRRSVPVKYLSEIGC